MSVAVDANAAALGAEPRNRLAGKWADTVLLIVTLALVWEVLTLILGADALPSPGASVAKLTELVSDRDFAGHLWETGRAFLAALVISLAGGLVLGLALGSHRLSGQVAEPILVALYSIPKITLYPVILLLFGLGVSAKIAFGVIHGIIPVAIFTMNGVRSIRPVYFRAGRAMSLDVMQTMRFIVIPAALPEVVSGFRLGFALTLLGTLIGEMFASQKGLGYLLVKAMETSDTEVVMALAVLLIIFATVASTLMLALERRLQHRPAS